MKRRGLWAACVVLLLVGVVAVLAVGAGGYAKDDAVAEYAVFDGNGSVNGVFSGNFNGEITRKEPYSGTYAVEADCTGTVTLNTGEQYDLFIAPDGGMYTFVQIEPPESVASGFELQGTAKRVAQ